MATLFTKIMNREIPGIFVYEDDLCCAFMSIAPLMPGHTLIVPRAEYDHWIDMPYELTTHVMQVAQLIGKAQMKAFPVKKIAVLIAGMEVPHTHVHAIPINHESEIFRHPENEEPAKLAAAAEAIKKAFAEIDKTGLTRQAELTFQNFNPSNNN